MSHMYYPRAMGNAPSARFYGANVGIGVIAPPPKVRVSEPWGPERYPAYGSRQAW